MKLVGFIKLLESSVLHFWVDIVFEFSMCKCFLSHGILINKSLIEFDQFSYLFGLLKLLLSFTAESNNDVCCNRNPWNLILYKFN